MWWFPADGQSWGEQHIGPHPCYLSGVDKGRRVGYTCQSRVQPHGTRIPRTHPSGKRLQIRARYRTVPVPRSPEHLEPSQTH